MNRTVALALAALALPSAASAQAAESPPAEVDVQNLWPTGGPAQSPTLRSSEVQPHLGFGFALVANYAYRPLVLHDAASPQTTIESIGHLFTTDFLWSLGLFDHLQLSAAVPLVAAQGGEGYAPLLGRDFGLPATALRDVRFEVSVAILRRERRTRAEGLGLRVDLGGAAPTGNGSALAGAPGFTFAPMVVADYRIAGLTFTANVGARIRPAGMIADVAWASQLVLGAGVAYRPAPLDRLALGVDCLALAPLYGGFTLTNGQSLTAVVPVELYVGGRYALDRARDIEAIVGVGAPLSRDATVPAFRALVGLSYAPRGLDDDRDGVLESDDECPSVPEDRDGFQDGDGCPERDNDGDRIVDGEDRCPNAPEDADNFEDGDGCPERDNDRDGVEDGADRCPTEAAGSHPDPARSGCPLLDRDEDGVADAADSCPDEPSGAQPDPARAGCPLPDRDRDGVSDADDFCPSDPVGAYADRFRAGCPDPDRDHDGVANEVDRCVEEPETINGTTDDDGCPDAGEEATRWSGDVLVFSNVIRLRGRVRALPPAARAALAQAAQRIRARGAEVARVSVMVVPGASSAGVREAERLALLVADSLAASGVARTLLTPGAAPVPAGGRAPAASAGEVRIRIERRAPASPTSTIGRPTPAPATVPPAGTSLPAAPARP